MTILSALLLIIFVKDLRDFCSYWFYNSFSFNNFTYIAIFILKYPISQKISETSYSYVFQYATKANLVLFTMKISDIRYLK